MKRKGKNGENIPKDGFFHRFFFSEIKPADGDACRFDLFIGTKALFAGMRRAFRGKNSAPGSFRAALSVGTRAVSLFYAEEQRFVTAQKSGIKPMKYV